MCCFLGTQVTAKLLPEQDDIDHNYPDKYDQTPLGWATSKGYEAVVDPLLGREDVNPNRPGGDGRTPLVSAAMNGHQELVKLLQTRISMEPATAHPTSCESISKLTRSTRFITLNPDGIPPFPALSLLNPRHLLCAVATIAILKFSLCVLYLSPKTRP